MTVEGFCTPWDGARGDGIGPSTGVVPGDIAIWNYPGARRGESAWANCPARDPK